MNNDDMLPCPLQYIAYINEWEPGHFSVSLATASFLTHIQSKNLPKSFKLTAVEEEWRREGGSGCASSLPSSSPSYSTHAAEEKDSARGNASRGAVKGAV